MLELGTRRDGGLANDFALARRRRMMGLGRGVTVSTLGAEAGAIARSGLVRGDIRRGFGTANGVARGVPLDIRVRLTSANSGRPLAGHAVYLWHCDRDGDYSLRSEGLENENYLRGIQAADSAGWVRFTSIFPGSHEGAWPRLHIEVYRSVALPGTPLHTADILLPADACAKANGTAGYDGHPGATVEMACVTGDVRRGLVATRTVAI
jgi:hypothetical protein